MHRGLLALAVCVLALSACSSSHSSSSGTGKATFCAAARRIKADNAAPAAQSSADDQRNLSETQFNAVKAAASSDERAGWADAEFPLPRAATGRLDAVLRKDCSLTIDIFGRTTASTKSTTKP